MTLSRSERDRMNAEAQLEHLIDAHGLEYMLELLASILLRQKADHIEQDDALAAEWSRADERLFSLALERMIDKRGLEYVVELLAGTCFAKADHIESNWQDDALAAEWTRAGNAFSKALEQAAKVSARRA